MDDLYREIIIERFKNPTNRGVVSGGIKADKANMTCGDKLEISAKVTNGIIEDVKFTGGGCAISMVAVDMLCDKLKGMKIKDAQNLTTEDIEEMLGMQLTLSRKKCANLGLETVKQLLDK